MLIFKVLLIVIFAKVHVPTSEISRNRRREKEKPIKKGGVRGGGEVKESKANRLRCQRGLSLVEKYNILG